MAQISDNGSRGHHKFTLNVNETYVSGSGENYSTISWSLVLSPIQTGWDWYYSNNAPVGYEVNINGSKVAKGSIMNYDGSSTVTIAEGTLKVAHDDDGTKKINFSFEVWDNINENYLPGSASESGSLKLTNIPRYANVTQRLNNKTETTININWTSDQTIDHLSYSIDDGSTWNDLDTEEVKSGMYQISGLSANTLYNVKTKVRRKDNQLVTTSSRLQIRTYDYPYCSKAPDFIIGEELNLELYNPLNRLVTIYFIGANGETLSSDTTAMSTVTGYNTETFKTKLYNSIPNSINGKYQVKITYEQSTKITDGGNYQVNKTECLPIFTDFEYKDNNGDIVNVTGNNQILIKDFSDLQVVINSTNKMVTQKGASPSKYNAVIEGINVITNHSDGEIILNLGTVTASGTKRLSVTAYDTREIPTTIYKDLIIREYTKPVINLEANRINKFEADTILKINGNYDRLTIDDVDKNSIQAVEYRYKETGTNEEWSSWEIANATLTNGKFTCNDVVIALDNTKGFDIEVRVTDKLDSSSSSASVDAGESIFFISTNNRTCYVRDKEVMVGMSKDINRTDLNGYTSDIVLGYGHNLENTPTSKLNLGHLISIPRHDQEGFVKQLFFPYTTNDIYIRGCNDGTWDTWQSIGGGTQLNTYSTEEEVVGYWINGQPIYRRSFSGNLANYVYTTITKDYTNNSIEIINSYGSVRKNNACGVPIGGYVNGNYYTGIYLHPEEVQLYHGENIKQGTYHLTIEFIKRN